MLGNLLSFGGGLISDMSNRTTASQNRRLTREQMAMQKAQFDAQMDQSVQRRVADARAAGVHPLFALGASVGASPTASIGGGQPATGSAAGKALTAIGNQIAAAHLASQSASAKRDEAEAAYIDAQRKKLESEIGSRGRDGATIGSTDPKAGMGQPDVLYGPPQPVMPTQLLSKKPGVQAGVNPAHEDIMLPGGEKVRIISKDLQLDEIRQIDYLVKVIWSNATTGSMKAYEAARKKLQDLLGRKIQYKGKDKRYGVTSPRGGPG